MVQLQEDLHHREHHSLPVDRNLIVLVQVLLSQKQQQQKLSWPMTLLSVIEAPLLSCRLIIVPQERTKKTCRSGLLDMVRRNVRPPRTYAVFFFVVPLHPLVFFCEIYNFFLIKMSLFSFDIIYMPAYTRLSTSSQIYI